MMSVLTTNKRISAISACDAYFTDKTKQKLGCLIVFCVVEIRGFNEIMHWNGLGSCEQSWSAFISVFVFHTDPLRLQSY